MSEWIILTGRGVVERILAVPVDLPLAFGRFQRRAKAVVETGMQDLPLPVADRHEPFLHHLRQEIAVQVTLDLHAQQPLVFRRSAWCSEETAARDVALHAWAAAESDSLIKDLRWELVIEASVARMTCVARMEGICSIVGRRMLEAFDNPQTKITDELESAFRNCLQQGHPGD